MKLLRTLGKRRALFHCDHCGSDVDRDFYAGQKNKSCGCRRTPPGIDNPNYRHGQAVGGNSRLYGIWAGMFTRCYSPKNKAYRNYGARGIKVCRQWRKASEFFKWAMASGYQDHLTIERRDNDADYCPSNCTWATRQQQARNKRRMLGFTHNGLTRTLCEWAEACGVSYIVLWKRLNRGWTPEQAMSLPPGTRIWKSKSGKAPFGEVIVMER